MAKKEIKGFEQLAQEQSLYPQEAPATIQKKSNQLHIGIPTESAEHEKRIALKPEAVQVLVGHGHEVLMQEGAGVAAGFPDSEYSEAGAQITSDKKKVLQSNLILKIAPPTPEEMEIIRPGTAMVSAFQGGRQSVESLEALCKKRITAIGFEFLEDKSGGLPLVRAMSEIAGSIALLVASEYLSSPKNGQGVILGGVTGVPPTKVVILGAGTVAEYSARVAIGLGVDIRVFDNHIYKLRRLKHALGQQVYTSTIDQATLKDSLAQADVVIGALRPEKGFNPCIVTEEMVQQMKPGAVIVDVSIDQGGCIETSEPTTHMKPVFTKYDVTHYCVPNMASRVARTASLAISNILVPVLLKIGEEGGIDDMIYQNQGFRKGVYTYRGSLTNLGLAKKFNLGYKDLNLLMAARM